jgi:hypothetical protein
MLQFDNQVVERFKKFRFGVKSVVPTITGIYPINLFRHRALLVWCTGTVCESVMVTCLRKYQISKENIKRN